MIHKKDVSSPNANECEQKRKTTA